MLENNHLISAQGMRENYIGNETLTETLFENVIQLQKVPHWQDIDKFMENEYLMEWINWKKTKSCNK